MTILEITKEIIKPVEILKENVEEIKENIQLPQVVKISKHYKNLEYKNKWIALNRDKVNNYAKLHYIKKINELGDEYRTKLKEKNKRTYKIRSEKKKLENPDIIKKCIGRPRKIFNIEDKKKCGRPILYNNNIDIHII